MFKHLKSNKGWAMAMVVVLLAVIPIFVVALYTYSMTSTKLVIKQIELERARYLARSGIEATVYVWQRADFDAKPTGNMERVYLNSDGTFSLESLLSADDIANNTLGYVDVTIAFNNDNTSNEYLTTKITAKGVADDSGQTMRATSLPYTVGHSIYTAWYNENSGLFETSNGSISRNIDFPESTSITYFNLEGIVTCDTKDKDGFTFQNGNTGIMVDTLFFNDELDLTAGSAKIVFITAKKAIFRDNIYLSDSGDLQTLILHASTHNAIEVKNLSGDYGAVYFRGDVLLNDTVIIYAGKNYYYKSREDGVDLVAWANNTGVYSTDPTLFFEIPASGDDNSFIPTETSSIYFIYE